MIKKFGFFIGFILPIIPMTVRAQCPGSWTSSSTLNYLCANGPFLQQDLGANICPAVTGATYTFSAPVQNVKLTFSAFGTAIAPVLSRMAVFVNNNQIDLNLACGIILGCQSLIGDYSIDNGCMVDSISGNDGGISGFIYLKATMLSLPSITSVGVAVSEPGSSGTIFEIDSCDHNEYKCITGIAELSSDKLTVYPNPANTTLSVMLQDDGKITIINLLGDIIMEKIYPPGKNSVVLDISSFAWGIYFIKTGNSISKFIKQ